MIRDAIEAHASDIHLDPPEGGEVRARLRIDGLLQRIEAPAADDYSSVVDEFQHRSGHPAAALGQATQGLIVTEISEKPYDLQVSVAPSLHGDRVVVRILPRDKYSVQLNDVGLPPDDLETIRGLCRRPNGIVIVNGPAGSGKTTLLYCMLHEMDREQRCVVSVEEPVEIDLPGVAQFQVNPSTGWTWGRAIKSALRQDLDVIMIGELRDLEVVQLMAQCAVTGHLVFSQLHAKTSVGALQRLLDIGLEPYMINATVEAVISQRLARVLCPHCKQPDEPDEKTMPPEAFEYLATLPKAQFFRPIGCPRCRSGHRGRTAIHEILMMDDTIRRLITQSADEKTLRQAAVDAGMKPIGQAGLERAAEGVTSLAEVLRVVG